VNTGYDLEVKYGNHKTRITKIMGHGSTISSFQSIGNCYFLGGRGQVFAL